MSTIPVIPGLQYLPHWITSDEEVAFLQTIQQQPWETTLRRRVQQYGYKYSYQRRTLSSDDYIGPLPNWLQVYADRLHASSYFSVVPNQVIINEYKPGQGIASHVDAVSCFGDTIASLTLQSGTTMQFVHKQTPGGSLVPNDEMYLERRSLVIMQREARYSWQHGIPARKHDLVSWGTQGPWKTRRERGTRISVTFRTVRAM